MQNQYIKWILGGAEYSETLGLDHFYGLGLGLEVDRKISDYVSKLRLRNSSLGLALEIETKRKSVDLIVVMDKADYVFFPQEINLS